VTEGKTKCRCAR